MIGMEGVQWLAVGLGEELLSNLLLPLYKRTAGEGGAEKAPCCGTVATAGAGAERLTCRTVAVAGVGAEVSPAVTSSHCSSMAACAYLCTRIRCVELYIYSFPLQLSKESKFSFVISSAELWPTLMLVLCVYALFSLPSSTFSHSVWSATTVHGRHR